MSFVHRVLLTAAMCMAVAGAVLVAEPARAQEGGDQAQPTKAQRYYISGTELMNTYRYLDAVEQFRLAIDEDPNYVDAYKSLAYVYTKMAETEKEYFEDALDTYTELEGLVPDDVEVKKNKAFVYAALEDLPSAIETYEEILKLTPEDCAAWGRLGELHQTLAEKSEKGTTAYNAEVEEAVKAYRKITEYCPDETYSYNKLGEIFYNADRTEEASQVYEELLKRDPENVEITGRLGYLWYSAGKRAEDAKNEAAATGAYEKAAPRFEKLLELDPSRMNYRLLYADTLKKLKNFEKSADEYLKVISEDESKKDMYCTVGFTYLDAKEWQKAIELAMKAISENAPKQACLYCIWGKGLEFKGTEQVQNYEFDRGMATYAEGKTKFTLAQGDSQFGDYATKQISRLDQLIERAKQMKMKYEQEGGK